MKRLQYLGIFLSLILIGGLQNSSFSQNCRFGINGIEIDPTNNHIYWSEIGTDQIMRGNLDGTGTPIVLFDGGDGVFQSRDVTIDLINNFIYWTKSGGFPSLILQGNLDGTGAITPTFDPFAHGLDGPNGIDINPAMNHLYWGEVNNQSIVLGDVIGSTVTTLFDNSDGLEGPRGLQVDLANGHIYWADFDRFAAQPVGRIFRGNIDGSGTPTVLFDLGNNTFPHSVAIDLTSGLIFWTDVLNNLIQAGNINGSGLPTTLFDENDGVLGARHIELNTATNELFWTEMQDGQLIRANADGSGFPAPMFASIFDGGGDGVNWDDPLNWSNDLEPDALSYVYIPSGFNVVIQLAGELAENVQIANGGSLIINNSADLRVENSCKNGVKLEIGANLTVNGSLFISDTLDDGLDVSPNTIVRVGTNGLIDVDDSGEDGIDLDGGSLINDGTITIDGSTDSGICLENSNNTASSFRNSGSITIDDSQDPVDGNGILVSGSQFDNLGAIMISNSGNDGISVEEDNGVGRFINYPSGNIQISTSSDDGVEVGSPNAVFQNVGPLTVTTTNDKGIDLEPGGRFTNDCTVTITGAQDAFDIPPTSTVVNRNRMDIGLDGGSGNPALAVGGTLQCDNCSIINITSSHEILTGGLGVINNDGIISTTFAGANNNNGTFNNNGEIRPATFTNAGNPINGNAPQAGAVPAISALGGNACTACLFFPIPTVSEWGLIILALLIMTIGVLFVTVPKISTTRGETFQVSIFKNLPFDRKRYFKNWMILSMIIFGIFTVAIQFLGYEMTQADPFGAMASSFLLAYLLFLLGRK